MTTQQTVITQFIHNTTVTEITKIAGMLVANGFRLMLIEEYANNLEDDESQTITL